MKTYRKILDSSVIHDICWDAENQILLVNFKTGSSWIYHNVDYSVYSNLAKSKSVGKYFNNKIRNSDKYFAQKISKQKELVSNG